VADPKDSSAASGYAVFLLKTAALDVPPEGLPESLATLRRAAAILESPTASVDYYQSDLALTYNYIGRRLIALGNYSEALGAYRHSTSITDTILASRPGDREALEQSFESARGAARVLALEGDRAEALEQSTTLLRRIERMSGESDPAFRDSERAQAWLSLAEVRRTLGDAQLACEAAAEAGHQASSYVTHRLWDPGARMVHEAQSILTGCSAKTGN
jgi:tetratricopeptide (TPR) repeat protein